MIVPRLTPDMTRTYQIVAPLPTHFRPATCEEIECAGYANGWKTRVIPGTPEHAQVLALKGRYHFTGPVRQPDGVDEFTFPAGQRCFRQSQHRVPLEREPFYIVKDGAVRGQSYRPQDWIDRSGEDLENLAARKKRG